MLKNIIITNRYFDSATLMLLTNKVKTQLNLKTEEIAIMMATEMNKRIMSESNLLNEVGLSANPGDVLIAIKSDMAEDEVLSLVEELLAKKAKKGALETSVTSIAEAIESYPESNFAVVSLPGVYAAREAKKLLNSGRHVLLFSDNVSLEDEISLKKLAVKKDLLLMGPDCGTAIVNGVGLGFSNTVKPGRIGIVAASGTGLQEVATIISNAGSGISQAFGTGGRDVKDAVGGIMMFYCLDLLISDPNTDVLVLVSKPPQPQVLSKLIEKLKTVTKPVVACFLGADEKLFDNTNIHFSPTLEGAAIKAIELEGKSVISEFSSNKIAQQISVKNPSGFIRGIYCGGTLAYEALLMLEDKGLEVYSNLAKDDNYVLHAKDASRKNSILDMGEDEFTVGKPHPMIDPSGRSSRIRTEAQDADVSVIIADVELGFGSNDEASKVLASDIKEVISSRPDITFIAVICGSHEDYQGYDATKKLLEDAGAIVPPSNAQAVRLALKLLNK